MSDPSELAPEEATGGADNPPTETPEARAESLARATLSHAFIQLSIHFPDALDELGLGASEALEQALRLAEEAIILAPTLPDGHTALGRILLCHDDPDAVADAAEVLRHALTLSPEHDPAEVAMATVQREQGDAAAAFATLDAVIRRGTALPQPYLLRALLHLDAGRPSDARRDVERAVKLAPEAGLFRLDAARVAELEGDAVAAREHDEAARALLGRAYEIVARLVRGA